MNPYKIKQIKSLRNKRTIDLFVKRNPGNAWLTLEDATRHTFETNKPEVWQLNAVHNFLFSICRREFSPNPCAVMEYSTQVEGSDWAYRLLNADAVSAESSLTRSAEAMMNDVVKRHAQKLEQKQMSEI